MGKKLLSVFFLLSIFFLSSWSGFGQCPTSVGITANPGTTICAGEEITFTANPTGGDNYTYQWQVNLADVNGETASTFKTTSLTNGQKVRVIVKSSTEGIESCSTPSSEVPISVNPIRTVTATIAANNSNICPGATINFSISSQTNITSGSVYEWRVNGESQGSANTFSGSSLVAGDEVQLWVDSAAPCTEPVVSNIITISEKPGAPATPGNINGETTVCPGASGLIYQIGSVANATSYEWQLPSGWAGTSTTNSITVTSGTTGNAIIRVRAKNECGNSEFQTLDVTVPDAVPAQPGTISGPTSVCPGVSAYYSISAVARATEYVWTLPNGQEQVTTIPNISVTTNTSGASSISIQARNTCGISAKRNLIVSLKPGKPATPEAITGSAAVCPGISQTYSVAAVTGATSYVWTLPNGWTGNSASRSITVTTGTTGGTISVIAKNDCADSDPQTLDVTINPGTPAVPEFNSPLTEVCPAETNTFTVNEVAGATGYIWTLPSGWSGISTTNTISITSANSGTGSISVQATNNCGTSAKKTIPVAIKPPTSTMNAVIQGPDNVCASTSGITFTIPEVQYATEYSWSAPGWNIANGQGTRTITLTSGTGAGNISVKAKNSCGESVAATKTVTITSGVPGQPGTITSSLDSNPNICPPKSGVTFTVPTVTGATGYEWSLPAGWEITSTNVSSPSITVNITANAAYQNEVVSVRARNVCGLGLSRSYSNITVSNFIITDLGADQLVCRSQTELSIPVELYFGNSNRLKPTWSTNGNGTFRNLPDIGGGNSTNNIPRNFTINYTPGPNDITKEYITITMTVPPPQSSSPCGTGKDEMRIYFRNSPTATIVTPAAICAGTSTNLTITGTPNSKVTYSKGTQTGLTVDIGPSGTATIPSGTLTANTAFTLTGITNLDAPTCSNSNLTSSATVTVTQKPTATITYAGPFCKSLNTTQTPTLSGTNAYTGGTYAATGDLATKITSTNGAFTPSNVSAGTYIVTYTSPASGGCEAVSTTTEVTITPLPTAAIAYQSSPFCSTDSTDQLVSLNGTNAYTGGTYSSTTGLSIDASTGVIKAASSTPGDYTVTYSLPAASGCGIVTVTAEVTVTEIPVPTISYTQSEICKEDTNTYSATVVGSGIVTGGTFSAPSGLSITSAGVITPSTSTPGTYKIIYTLAPANGCGQITAETNITITPVPSVEITYAGPFCESTTGSKEVSYANGVGAYENGSFAVSPSGLTINSTTGAINPSTSNAGDYTVTYNIPSGGGCESKIAETTVNITAVPGATLSYPDAPFCSADTNSYTVSYSNTEGNYENGAFTGTTGLIIDSLTGAITPEGSTPGTHTVTYTIPTADGCESVTTTVNIEIVKPVEITAQPFNVGKCAGETARLEVVAEGKDLTYQWFRNGSEVTGATSKILEFFQVTPGNAGEYHVEISGSAPCSSITSETASLIVDQNIIVDSTPEDKDLCVGDSTSFTVEASANGGTVEYQWMRDGEELPGETNNSISLNNISLDDEGEYSVFLNGPQGFTCSTLTYTAGSLKVNEQPTVEAGNAISACTTSNSVQIGTDAVATNYSSLTWTTSGTGSFENANTLTTNYIPGAGETGEITLILTANGNATCNPASDEVIITISPLPVINSFSYSAAELCISIATAQVPNLDLSNATIADGSFSYIGNGNLSLNEFSGEVIPSSSEPGDYIINFTIPSNGICAEVLGSFELTIGDLPVAAFSYDASAYCRDTREDIENDPVISINSGGEDVDIFSYTGTGTLALNTSNGEIDIYNSTAGTYTVKRVVDYSGDAEDGCEPVEQEQIVNIFDKPIPDFTYAAAEYCSVGTNPLPAIIGDASLSTFTATPAGISINASTGEIDLANSAPNTYTITNAIDKTDDACSEVTAIFILKIDKKSDATFAYNKPAYCITDITATVQTGYETGGTFSSLTLGTHLDSGTGTITWNPTEGISGLHSITYTIPGKGACEDVSSTLQLQIDAKPVGGTLSWSNDERIYLTCEVQTNDLQETLTLKGFTGQIIEWEYRTASTLNWSTYESQSASLSNSDFKNILGNTVESSVFRAKIANGACAPGIYSQTAILSVIPLNIKPSPVKVDPAVLCYGTDINLSSETGYGYEYGQFEGGDFTSAGIKNNGWNFTNPNGNEVDYNASANSGAPNHWHKTQPKWKFTTANINSPYNTSEMWWNPLDDGKQNEHFAIAQSTFSSNMDTPSFNLTAIDEGIVTFDQAFNLTTNATIRVVLLKNGVEYKELYKIVGPASSQNYNNFGYGTPDVNQMNLDLGNYIGESNLKIRFEYRGVRAGDIWAVDNIKVPDGPQGVLLQWFYDESSTDPNNTLEQIGLDNQNNVSFKPRKIGRNDFEVKTALLLDSNGDPCEDINNSETVRVFVFDQYETNVAMTTGSCGQLTAKLNASISGAFQGDLNAADVTADGYKGEWKVVGPAGVNYTLTNEDETSELNPVNNPNAIFEADKLAEFQITWELKETFTYPNDYFVEELRGQKIINSTCPPTSNVLNLKFENCTTLDFDGTDDVAVIESNFAGAKAFEAWIRPEVAGGIIISGPSFEITTPAGVNVNGRWYHLAVIYDGDDVGLYIDGIRTGNAPSGNGGGTRTSIGARWTSANTEATDHFSGWIEEVRIWKNSPSLKEIKFMMNQRLKLDVSGIVVNPLEGEIVPNRTIPGSYYTADGNNLDKFGDPFYDQTGDDLFAYYRLISEVPDPDLNLIRFDDTGYIQLDPNLKPFEGDTPDHSGNDWDGRLYNMNTHQQNTSPTPYFSKDQGEGLWYASSTWARESLWAIPAQNNVNWNIVKTRMKISSGSTDITVLGLISEVNTLEMIGTNPNAWVGGGTGNPLYVTHYLKLDGVIDLQGESQLIQPQGSIVDGSSSGSLQRDQQGTANSYNYNYWSSPVSSGASNSPYTVAGVLRDGTNSLANPPVTISFGDPYAFADTGKTNPIKISNYWISIFNGAADQYGEWAFQYGSVSAINVGEGYTMKGTSGAVPLSTAQNYTFVGLPNNGTVELTIGTDKNYLLGNPYPSAIDAYEFINDNLKDNGGKREANYFDGALYFWDHFGKEDSHILLDYVGGYASLTKIGGVPAISNDDRINDNMQKNTKVPGRYIPVGQGFFINSTTGAGYTISPGDIKFANDQREFITEEGNSQFLKPEEHVKSQKEPEIEKIRISYKSPLGYYRQILVGAHPSATNGFDLGYDAPLFDYNKEDMYWIQESNWLVIQGVSNFDKEQVLPLGVVLEEEGEFTIKIDELENMDADKMVYINDKLNDTIHNLTKEPFVATSKGGYINDRFEIIFYKDEVPIIKPGQPGGPTEPAPGETPPGLELDIRHGQDTKQLQISNPLQVDITNVYVYDLNGKLLQTYYNIANEKVVLLPVRNFSSGVYIVKLNAENQVISKKIIINN